MARSIFFLFAMLGPFLIVAAYVFWAPFLWLFVLYAALVALGIHDLFFSSHNVLRNFPIIGHMRFLLEGIGPEIRQYFIETDESGKPFNRITRSLIYRRAKNLNDTQPFGTQHDIYETGYSRINHSLSPQKVSTQESRVMIGGPDCLQPYCASRLNISAMSFGSLSPNALLSLNAGAKLGGFAHNTGEGGISPYHLENGGDLIWQIGTSYFGCRTTEGNFDAEKFRSKATTLTVKAIEIKLSQGAKPAHGGILPGAKVSAEIADVRGVEIGKDVISPPSHTRFDTPLGLLDFVQELRTLSEGKPIGFKLCIGKPIEFLGICKAMVQSGITPDFITIDGSEGGTGAAPVEYSNHLGAPLNEGLVFVDSCLKGTGLRKRIKLIASGKITNGYDMVEKVALGADVCNSARGMMFALGCIQALQCNSNKCPTGITTQDKRLMRAIQVDDKKHRVANFHRHTVDSFLELVGSMGYSDPDHVSTFDIKRRIGDETERTLETLYPSLPEGAFLKGELPDDYARAWELASAERFSPDPTMENHSMPTTSKPTL
ncbi:MAG: FMN-binding glutamate synthase family protein [Halioglobus sp.]